MDSNQVLTMKQVIEITGMTDDLIRDYIEEFNIQIGRTKGGHRRFSEENVQTLIQIRNKVREQNWSYKQVREWLNGGMQLAAEPTTTINELKAQMDTLLKTVEMLVGMNVALQKQVDEMHQNQIQQGHMLLLQQAAAANEVPQQPETQPQEQQQQPAKKSFWNWFGKKKA